jgi:hypothetical protein
MGKITHLARDEKKKEWPNSSVSADSSARRTGASRPNRRADCREQPRSTQLRGGPGSTTPRNLQPPFSRPEPEAYVAASLLPPQRASPGHTSVSAQAVEAERPRQRTPWPRATSMRDSERRRRPGTYRPLQAGRRRRHRPAKTLRQIRRGGVTPRARSPAAIRKSSRLSHARFDAATARCGCPESRG